MISSQGNKLYRADCRKNRKRLIPKYLYNDGGSCRPKNCEHEIAFSDSIGGALYGAVQNFAHDMGFYLKTRKSMFYDSRQYTLFYVYQTDMKSDYEPCLSSFDSMMNCIVDFFETGEERFCRSVNVELIGKCPISAGEIIFMSELIFVDSPVWFDFERALQYLGTEDDCVVWLEILRGNQQLIDLVFYDEPQDSEIHGVEGFHLDVVNVVIKYFEAKFIHII